MRTSFGFFVAALHPLRRTETASGWWQVVAAILTAAIPSAAGVIKGLESPPVGGWAGAVAWAAGVFALLFLVEGIRTRHTLTALRREIAVSTPVLRWGDPFAIDADVDFTPGTLWRIRLENITPGTVAKRTSIRMDNPQPPIVMSFPISLHRMHDNTQPFEKSFDLRYGEPVTLDVFASGQSDPPMYYLYRSDAPNEEQLGSEWMLSGDDNNIIDRAASGDGWMFDLIGTPDPPGKSERVTLRFGYSQDGAYRMLKVANPQPASGTSVGQP